MAGRSRRQETLDVLVVGGGVHGAAVARDAAARGLSVQLLEKRDFGWGTSSRSSKLAHGGLRYLERLQVGLVRESLQERDVLLRLAPHLAWPLPFLIPLAGALPRPAWQVRVGLFTYGLLAGSSPLARHRVIGEDEIRSLAPALSSGGVDRAALYHDAGMDDERLVVEMVVDATRLGADCRAHCEVTGFLRSRGRVVGARWRDAAGRQRQTAAAITVAAAGPWTNRLARRRADGSQRLVLTKGVHVFVRRELVRGAALLLSAPQDARIFFVIPWRGGTLVGTTDTYFRGSPDRVRATGEDVRYLLDATNACLPGSGVRAEDVVAVQAGLRPLVAAGDADSPSAVSRDFRLDDDRPGLIVIEGGKYTIFRKLAEAVVDRAAGALRRDDPERAIGSSPTLRRPLPGAPEGPWPEERTRLLRRLARAGVPAASARHLADTYGVRAAAVVAAAGRRATWLRPACDEHPHLPAEALVAVREELAVAPADVLLRRLGVGWWDCGGLRCRAAWAKALEAAGLSRAAVRRGLDEHERELAELWRA